MRVFGLTALLTLGIASGVSAATCRNPNTGRIVPCVASYGAATPGVGRTVVVAGPAARVRPIVRCGAVRCGRVAVTPVAPPPATTMPAPRPAPGYTPQ